MTIRRLGLVSLGFLLGSVFFVYERTALGEEKEEVEGSLLARSSSDRFRLKAELKVNFRSSSFVESKVNFPFPPDFIPPGADGVYLRTADEGESLELSNVALIGEAEISPEVSGRVVVHFVDLYNRNPTSSGGEIFVREAWVQLGRRAQGLSGIDESVFYALIGKAPRFSRQTTRRLESYGLWGTAVGRLESIQVQAGGSFGENVYWRAHVGGGNPVFMRDPNALAADNGTDERVPGHVDPIFESGFPILYETWASDVNFNGNMEVGIGGGFRWSSEENGAGVDALGWYFRRKLADEVHLHGSFYKGDLDVLRGAGIPLPFQGDTKFEYGFNAEARWSGLHAFVQYVNQEIAELPRRGLEIELAYRAGLGGLFAAGDTPIFNWIQPAFRYSKIDNRFAAPAVFVAPSFAWDWTKYDLGVRVGIASGLDLTAEYTRNTAIRKSGTIHPNEVLVTLRAGF